MAIILLAVVMLSGCSGGGSNGSGQGTATTARTLMPATGVPQSHGEISDMRYVLDNLRYMGINNTNYQDIDMTDMFRQQMAPPVGEEALFAGIKIMPLNNRGTEALTIGQKNYNCYVLGLMVPDNGPEEGDIVVETSQINAASYKVTYFSGKTKFISLVDDGSMRYWRCPQLAGYPLRVDIHKGGQRYLQTVE